MHVAPPCPTCGTASRQVMGMQVEDMWCPDLRVRTLTMHLKHVCQGRNIPKRHAQLGSGVRGVCVDIFVGNASQGHITQPAMRSALLS